MGYDAFSSSQTGASDMESERHIQMMNCVCGFTYGCDCRCFCLRVMAIVGRMLCCAQDFGGDDAVNCEKYYSNNRKSGESTPTPTRALAFQMNIVDFILGNDHFVFESMLLPSLNIFGGGVGSFASRSNIIHQPFP